MNPNFKIRRLRDGTWSARVTVGRDPEQPSNPLRMTFKARTRKDVVLQVELMRGEFQRQLRRRSGPMLRLILSPKEKGTVSREKIRQVVEKHLENETNAPLAPVPVPLKTGFRTLEADELYPSEPSAPFKFSDNLISDLTKLIYPIREGLDNIVNAVLKLKVESEGTKSSNTNTNTNTNTSTAVDTSSPTAVDSSHPAIVAFCKEFDGGNESVIPTPTVLDFAAGVLTRTYENDFGTQREIDAYKSIAGQGVFSPLSEGQIKYLSRLNAKVRAAIYTKSGKVNGHLFGGIN